MTLLISGNKTILYYSGNFKDPYFERKVQETILVNCNGLPIVSVTQKPTDFGNNICVGERGKSYLNVFRQMLIGAREIKTDYIVFVEDDCLYPPDYFVFEPLGEDFYRYDNVWQLSNSKNLYRKIPYACVQIVKTDYVIKVLEEGLKSHPKWIDNRKYKMFIKEIDVPTNFTWFTGAPVIVYKPEGNISNKGTIVTNTSRNNIEYWGRAVRLKRKLGVI